MATSRSILIAASSQDTNENIKKILKDQVFKERQVNLSEVFAELNRKQREKLCQKLNTVVKDELNSLLVADNRQTNDQKSGADSCGVLVGMVVTLCSVVQEKNSSAEDFLPIIQLLHDHILDLPNDFNNLGNRICQLCQVWIKGNLNGKESISKNAFIYLLKHSTLLSNVSKSDVKRVWMMKECLSSIDLDDGHIFHLVKLCATSSSYVQIPEGRKFISYLLGLNIDYVVPFHKEIKMKLVSSSDTEAFHYGDVYLRAWLLATDNNLREKLEFDCIQDFIDHAVHASSQRLFKTLHKLLGYMNGQKDQRQVGEMLYRLYAPILWRSLKVANPVVRSNAASIFFSAFPVEDPTSKIVEREADIERQLHLIEDLLYDSCPDVRSVAIKGLCTICDTFWEMIPPSVMKSLLMHLVEDLAFDAASVKVRISVFQGISNLVKNPMSHPFLKAVLPKIGKCFHDISEAVRVAFLEMFLKLKGLKTIKYWEVVSVEELLDRLAVDSPSVCRRIVSLISSGYHPLNKGNVQLLEQSIDLIATNRAASRRFYLNAHHFLDLNNIVNYMLLVCNFLIKYTKYEIKRAIEAGELEEIFIDPYEEENNDENSDDDDTDCNVSMHELPADLVAGLLDAVCILWVQIRPALNKKEGEQHNKKLVAKYGGAMTKFYKIFKESDAAPSLFYLSSFLPCSQVFMSVSYCMSQLRSLPPNCSSDTYTTLLESLCNWGRGSEVLELIIEWLNAELHKNHNLSQSKRREGKTVRFRDDVVPHPKLALELLSFLLDETSCRQLLLTGQRTIMIELLNVLREVQRVLELQLSGDDCDMSEEFTSTSFAVMCKLALLLHGDEIHPFNGIQFMSQILEWVETRVLPKLLMNIDENSNESHSRSILVRKKKSSDRRRAFSSNLALSVIENSVCVSRWAVMCGVIDVNLAASFANFCGAILKNVIPIQHEEGYKMLHEVVSSIQQLQEYGLIGRDANKVIYEVTVPSLLSSVLKSMQSYLEKFAKNKTMLASAVKPPVLEMLKQYECYVSKDCNALRNVIAAMMASVVSDIAKHVQKDNLSMELITDIQTLPSLSYVLLSIVISKVSVVRHFICELIGCIRSQVIQDPFGFFSFLTIFSLFNKHKVPKKDLTAGIQCLEDNVRSANNQTSSEHVAGDVKIWEPRTNSSIKTYQTSQAMTAMSVHPAADVFACGSVAQFITIYSYLGENLSLIKYHDGFVDQRIGPISSLAFHPFKMNLAAGSTDSIISVYAGDRRY